MSVHYADATVTLHHGDCLDVLRSLPDASVDSVVTDPPYGLGFMGKEWDKPTLRADFTACVECGNDDPTEGWLVCSDCLEKLGDAAPKRPVVPAHGGRDMLGHVSKNWNDKGTHSRGYADNDNAAFQKWCKQWAAECLRVLKPGGHLLAFGGTRTWHRLAVAVEDAGFEVRDSIAWLYGSGFPKSLDVSKAITGTQRGYGGNSGAIRRATMGDGYVESGRQGNRDGAGRRDTGLNAHALDLTPDAEQWQGWGTALKPAFEPVVVGRKPLVGTVAANVLTHGTGALNIDGCRIEGAYQSPAGGEPVTTNDVYGSGLGVGRGAHDRGRWPANVVLDESQAQALDEQSGALTSGKMQPTHTEAARSVYGQNASGGYTTMETYGDTGGASRFFYVAKADASERPRVNGTAHPTVKPLALMRWLVRLVTPPGGTVLEPFAGSGTTVEACIVEGFHCIAIEREADYLPLIEARIARRRDPVKAITLAGDDLGLFGEATG